MREVLGCVGRCDSCQKCDSPKEVCQLVGRCDGHGEKQKGLRRCVTWQEV